MRLLLLACLPVVLAAAPIQAAPVSPAPAKPVVSPAPSPAPAKPVATPAPRTFFGLPTGNRWTAVGLSLAVNGLGQFYNDEPEKGKLMMASLLSFPVAYGVDALTGTSYMRVFSYAVVLSVKVWSSVDAYQNAVPAPSPTPSPAPSLKPAG